MSASVHVGIPPPRCGPGDRPRCGPGDTPPRPDLSTSPLGVDLETCKACWDTTPRDLQRMMGYHHMQCMLGYQPNPPPPPCTEFLTHATENITLPQTLFVGGKNDFALQKTYGQDCIPVGCIPPACLPYLPACTAQGGSPCQGVSACQGGVCLARGCLPCQGVSALPGGCLLAVGIPACTEATPPPVERILDTRY